MLRPIAVNTRRQAFDAVDVKIKVDETCCSEIGDQRLFCAGEESRSREELRSSVDSFNQWLRYLLLRQPIGVTTKQYRLDSILHAHGNGWAVKPDDQHGPLILTEVTLSRYLFVRELAKREAFTPHRSSGKGKSLPGMSDVVQA